jgi:hypothetical protein
VHVGNAVLLQSDFDARMARVHEIGTLANELDDLHYVQVCLFLLFLPAWLSKIIITPTINHAVGASERALRRHLRQLGDTCPADGGSGHEPRAGPPGLLFFLSCFVLLLA